MALANMVRASAGAGDRARYGRARAGAIALVQTPACCTLAAEALLVVAQGDVSLGEGAGAEEAGRPAAAPAASRGEARTRMAAEAQLEAARNARAVAAPASVPEPPALAR